MPCLSGMDGVVGLVEKPALGSSSQPRDFGSRTTAPQICISTLSATASGPPCHIRIEQVVYVTAFAHYDSGLVRLKVANRRAAADAGLASRDRPGVSPSHPVRKPGRCRPRPAVRRGAGLAPAARDRRLPAPIRKTPLREEEV